MSTIEVSTDGHTLSLHDAVPFSRVSIWDTATGEKIAELPVDPVAIRVLASPDGKLVATSNIASGTISLFDAETRAPLKKTNVSGDAATGKVTLLSSTDSKRPYAAGKIGKAPWREGVCQYG